MVRQFAGQPPRVASGVVYAAGYAAGALVALMSYLVSGAWKAGVMAVRAAFGVFALFLAQRKGVVPEARN